MFHACPKLAPFYPKKLDLMYLSDVPCLPQIGTFLPQKARFDASFWCSMPAPNWLLSTPKSSIWRIFLMFHACPKLAPFYPKKLDLTHLSDVPCLPQIGTFLPQKARFDASFWCSMPAPNWLLSTPKSSIWRIFLMFHACLKLAPFCPKKLFHACPTLAPFYPKKLDLTYLSDVPCLPQIGSFLPQKARFAVSFWCSMPALNWHVSTPKRSIWRIFLMFHACPKLAPLYLKKPFWRSKAKRKKRKKIRRKEREKKEKKKRKREKVVRG